MIKNKTLAIFGYGGHSKVIRNLALLNGYNNFVFFDDYLQNKEISGNTSDLLNFKEKINDLFIAVGNNNIRKEKFLEFNKHFNLISLIHPKSVISNDTVKIGSGTVIMAGVILNPLVKIGNCCIINTGSIIDHETKISDYVHISPGVNIGGQVKIGQCSWLGIGSTVINNISISDNVVLGASSLLIKNASKNSKYVGIPASKINE